MSETNSSPLLFIVGYPRSGTTLLATLLDRHSRIAVPPETEFFVRSLDWQKRLWRRLGLFRTHDRVLSAPCCRGLERWPIDLREVREEFRRGPATHDALYPLLIRAYAAARGKTIAAEKTPQHLEKVFWLLQKYPEARFVCIVRDGRDAVLSVLRSIPQLPDLVHNCWRWRRYAREAFSLARERPDRFKVVRFESLLEAPEVCLREVCAFVGVDFEPEQLDPSRTANVAERFETKWKRKAGEALDPSRAYAWRQEDDAGRLALMSAIMGNELAQLGYPDSGPMSRRILRASVRLRLIWSRFVRRPIRFVRQNVARTLRWFGLGRGAA